MLFRVLMAVFLAGVSIWLACRVDRRTNVASTVTYVIFPLLFASFAWDDWVGWQAASGTEAVQYSIAFGCMCVATAATLIALVRRVGWLRHHKHGGWTGWVSDFGTGGGSGGISGRHATSAGGRTPFLVPIALLLAMLSILSVLTVNKLPFLVPIAMLLPMMSILFVFMVNRRANVARTILCVLFPVLSASLAWSYWNDWHTSSRGNDALMYATAFVCLFVTFAATLIALGRRVGWLRHHQQDG